MEKEKSYIVINILRFIRSNNNIKILKDIDLTNSIEKVKSKIEDRDCRRFLCKLIFEG